MYPHQVTRIGAGGSRTAWATQDVVALVPLAGQSVCDSEPALLTALATVPNRGFGSARPIARVDNILIQTRLRGRPPEPAEIARAAASIHRLPVVTIGPHVSLRYPTWRAHAQAELDSTLDGIEHEPVASLAAEWCRIHLPPPEPSVVVHGDLNVQNVRVDGAALNVLDWADARLGDPAYDLAAVSTCPDLLSYYREAGGMDVSERSVRFYRVCFALAALKAALHDGEDTDPPEAQLIALTDD